MKKVEIGEKTTILVVIVILAILYLVGVFTGFKKERSVEFTITDIRAIESAMEIYGDTIIVSKNKKGELILNIRQIEE